MQARKKKGKRSFKKKIIIITTTYDKTVEKVRKRKKGKRSPIGWCTYPSDSSKYTYYRFDFSARHLNVEEARHVSHRKKKKKKGKLRKNKPQLGNGEAKSAKTGISSAVRKMNRPMKRLLSTYRINLSSCAFTSFSMDSCVRFTSFSFRASLLMRRVICSTAIFTIALEVLSVMLAKNGSFSSSAHVGRASGSR